MRRLIAPTFGHTFFAWLPGHHILLALFCFSGIHSQPPTCSLRQYVGVAGSQSSELSIHTPLMILSSLLIPRCLLPVVSFPPNIKLTYSTVSIPTWVLSRHHKLKDPSKLLILSSTLYHKPTRVSPVSTNGNCILVWVQTQNFAVTFTLLSLTPASDPSGRLSAPLKSIQRLTVSPQRLHPRPALRPHVGHFSGLLSDLPAPPAAPYSPHPRGTLLKYESAAVTLLLSISLRIKPDVLPIIPKTLSLIWPGRLSDLMASTTHLLAYSGPPRCLRVFAPEVLIPRLSARLSPLLLLNLLSNATWI